ncbi:hypothetical protein MIR68_006231 [Amoeboaphelidium protococcarum]|nr:hypothetical protein MIR68_006231 [Amoeboaphelidium protococcarum]
MSLTFAQGYSAVSKATGLAGTFALGYGLLPVIFLIDSGKKKQARNALALAIASRSFAAFLRLLLLFYGTDGGAATAFWFISAYLAFPFRIGAYYYLYIKAQVFLQGHELLFAMSGCIIDILHDLVYRGIATVKLTPNDFIKSDYSGLVPELRISHNAIGLFLVVIYQTFLMKGLQNWFNKGASSAFQTRSNYLMSVIAKSNTFFIFMVAIIRIIDGSLIIAGVKYQNSVFDVSEIFHQLWIIFLVLDFVMVKEASTRSATMNNTQQMSTHKTATAPPQVQKTVVGHPDDKTLVPVQDDSTLVPGDTSSVLRSVNTDESV